MNLLHLKLLDYTLPLFLLVLISVRTTCGHHCPAEPHVHPGCTGHEAQVTRTRTRPGAGRAALLCSIREPCASACASETPPTRPAPAPHRCLLCLCRVRWKRRKVGEGQTVGLSFFSHSCHGFFPKGVSSL